MVDTTDRVALPIRVHEFLLACAGRIDDDALTDARELLAVAELDRAVELLAGSLIAGQIPLRRDEGELLRELVGAVRSPAGLIERLVVDDRAPRPRHRFTVGSDEDPAPDEGVAEAAARVVQVLPDIRSMWCVWRITPAGATAGPVPQRVVLVETGPDGFAPSTAYRVEQSLRRSGVRAVVEVVQAGTQLGDYHRDALAVARRVSLGRPAATARPPSPDAGYADFATNDPPAPRPVTSTRRRAAAHERRSLESASGRWQQRIAAAENQHGPAQPGPAQQSQYAGSAQHGGPAQHGQYRERPQARREPQGSFGEAARESYGDRRADAEPPHAEPAVPVEPAHERVPAESAHFDRPQADTELSAPDLSSAELAPGSLPPVIPPPPARLAEVRPSVEASLPNPVPPGPPEPAFPEPGHQVPADLGHADPAGADAARVDPALLDRTPAEIEPEPRGPGRASAEPTLREPMPVRPEPIPEPAAVEPPTEPVAEPEPAIAAETRTTSTPAPGSGKQSTADADLSQREQELLRQLHEELAKREQPEEPEHRVPDNTVAWQVERSGQRSSAFPAVDYGAGWQGSQEQTAVNGIPPYTGP